MTEFHNLVKKYIYPTLTGETSLRHQDITAIFLITLILGLYIFFVYRKQTKSEFYSKDFNITLPGLSIVTAGIMIAMQANLLVSLGMVGSLSIVRFRTAVKNPLDLLYLFWSISIGIICGVGLYSLALFLSIGVTFILLGLGFVNNVKTVMLLILNSDLDTDMTVLKTILKKYSKKSKLSSVNIKGQEKECIYEVLCLSPDRLVKEIAAVPGIRSVNLISNTGERRF